MRGRSEIPDVFLERFVLNEIPEALRRTLERRIREDGGVKDRVTELEASNRQILKQYPVGAMAAEIRRRHERSARSSAWSRLAWMAVPVAAAASALALFVMVPVFRQGGLVAPGGPFPEQIERVRPKGTAFITVYRKGDRGAEDLQDGDVVQAGDLLQVSYTVKKEKHGVIVSMDGKGVVTLHFPRTESGSTRLKQEGSTLLPYAYELDDAPAFERFLFVTSERRIDVNAVLKSTRALKGDSKQVPRLPPGVTLQTDLTFNKPSHDGDGGR